MLGENGLGAVIHGVESEDNMRACPVRKNGGDRAFDRKGVPGTYRPDGHGGAPCNGPG